jgi:hypothetical protein
MSDSFDDAFSHESEGKRSKDERNCQNPEHVTPNGRQISGRQRSADIYEVVERSKIGYIQDNGRKRIKRKENSREEEHRGHEESIKVVE